MLAGIDWMEDGACRDTDTDLFFPLTNSGPDVVKIATAKGICRGCDIRERCLEWALNNNEFGIWGGTTERDREKIKRRRRRSGWKRVPNYDRIHTRGVPTTAA